MTNKEFAAQDQKFRAACSAAGEEKKKSDEDKHRNNKGLANQSKGKKNG